MSTIRVSKDSNYSCINNQLINNAGLSWAARGLLVYLLSKPDDWTVNVEHLIEESPSGRDHVYTLLKELETSGYLTRAKHRDGKGRWSWEHVLREVPFRPGSLKNPNESPSTAEPDLAKPEINQVLNNQVLNKRTPLPPTAPPAAEQPNGSTKRPMPPFNGVAFSKALAVFREHRKEIKEPLTVHAEEILFRKLAKWGESKAIEALENSVLNRWRGVFEPRPSGNGYPPNPNLPSRDAEGRAKLVL